ncbi:MAG: triose-phosphate isomerase [Rhizobiales bacterium]|nr:triose-phosphate isomerase [Hyphomicrobiales bacterium]NRB14848.1 triose-phosphate isomerase [Hyphomicrobiales bacterium]
MTNQPKALVAGNWKMNGLTAAITEIDSLNHKIANHPNMACELMICPPATILATAVLRAENLEIGAQDCHAALGGAHTGDVSTEMLTDLGVTAVILGHSERRADHGETSAQVAEKVVAAQRAGLVSIICVGETEAERKSGQALGVVSEQIAGSIPLDGTHADNIVVAYEPVWAIGTGLVPSVADVAEMHAHIRDLLKGMFENDGDKMRILYGGSVKGSNAAELMNVDNVNGALVGGASLKADDFFAIVEAAYL